MGTARFTFGVKKGIGRPDPEMSGTNNNKKEIVMQNWKKALESMKRTLCFSLVLAMLAVNVRADETATLSVKSIPNVNIRMYGFIETDLINDSTQGFTEE